MHSAPTEAASVVSPATPELKRKRSSCANQPRQLVVDMEIERSVYRCPFAECPYNSVSYQGWVQRSSQISTAKTSPIVQYNFRQIATTCSQVCSGKAVAALAHARANVVAQSTGNTLQFGYDGLPAMSTYYQPTDQVSRVARVQRSSHIPCH